MLDESIEPLKSRRNRSGLGHKAMADGDKVWERLWNESPIWNQKRQDKPKSSVDQDFELSALQPRIRPAEFSSLNWA